MADSCNEVGLQGQQQLAESKAQVQKPVICKEALEAYGERFGNKQQSGFGHFDHQAFPWNRTNNVEAQTNISKESVMAVLEKDLGLKQGALKTDDPLKSAIDFKGVDEDDTTGGYEVDSDGEEVRLCKQCNLPLGNVGFLCMHGECRVQSKVQNMRSEEEKRIAGDRAKQDKVHAEYGIGWGIDRVPRNSSPAAKLAMRDVPEGMICLVLDESNHSIRIASTTEPAAAMNLEYLSIALEVRRREGHEPIFSLDPVSNSKNSMQAKVFIPEWLAGTAAGEVLFQSDYHLKELSMGEYDQPVVGMKSCFDFSEMETPSKWCARQWFVVRKAEVQICDSDVLLPYVKMGVEAREQVANSNTLEDKMITRPDHPMVKYAEGFTQNFDLIAERKSVIYHLRELAKASVLAKYLLDSHAQLEETWFQLSSGQEFACSMEVPQLWHKRLHAMVGAESTSLPCMMMPSERSCQSGMHGVYGGVNFGLEKFNLATSRGRAHPPLGAGLQASLSASRVPLGLSRVARQGAVKPFAAGLSLAPVVSAGLGLGLSQARGGVPAMQGGAPVTSLKAMVPARFMAAGRLPSSLSAVGVPRLGPMLPPSRGLIPVHAPTLQAALATVPAGTARPGMVASPQDKLEGVDLRLDNFDLSVAKRVSLEAQSGSWGNLVKPLDECMSLGESFWSSLGKSSPFQESDQALLKNIFNPFLTDRRSEGDRFTPPDASYSHVAKLRALVKEEEAVRQRRLTAFCSKDFMMTEPGSLFPSSWSSKLQILKGKKQEGVPETRSTKLVERTDCQAQAAEMLEGVLTSASPEFDKITEDGMRFRVYRVGSLEVRTTQEHSAKEAVGVIFSCLGAETDVAEAPKGQQAQPQEKIIKATEYVEVKFLAGAPAGHCYYLLLETERGNKIVTERLEDGRVTFEESPKNLEDRNSLAKVTRTKECGKGATVRDIQKRVDLASQQVFASASVCKLWSRSTFGRLTEKPKKEEDPVLAAKRKEKLAQSQV